MLLEYENELLLNSVQENQLCVLAKGIPLERVLTNLLKTYASEMHLVFVLSTYPNEEAFFISRLPGEKIMSVTNEHSASERKQLYAGGGVFFVTARILVVDFLKDVIPSDKITGFVVFRAHEVMENSQEAFILRLYRSKNKTGFIKAFSQSPTSFLLGFSKLNRVMRHCFLANVSLWPRFHSSIKETLSKASADVVEIQLHLTPAMKEIQTNLLDLVGWSLSELKRYVSALNDEEVTPEIALTKGFEKIISMYVDPVWNTVSSKSKEVMNDLKIFRLLLALLTKADCVSFYSVLCQHTRKDAAIKSSWVLTKHAENIILAARARLFPQVSDMKKVADLANKPGGKRPLPNFNPEVHPKWLALSEILNEIYTSVQKQAPESESSENFGAKTKTLVLAEDTKTCVVIRDYLSNGSDATMAKIATNCENIKVELTPDIVSKLDKMYQQSRGVKRFNQGRKPPGKVGRLNDDDMDAEMSSGPSEIQVTLTQIERKYEDIEFLQSPVFIRPMKNLTDSEAFAISDTLEKLSPDVIILFDPNLELVRNIEVYRARVAGTQNVLVYFLSFHNSVEEQIYLTSIQREKTAFERMIEEKATMVVPNEREARDELNQDLWRDPTKANETVSTSGQSKRNMQNDEKETQVILVDMREIRAGLLSMIYNRNIDLVPITLDVGDYILTPDICVERKSISDLIGSLNSGRLYKQAEAMTRHYKKPVLLIEHEQQSQSVAKGHRYRNDLAQIMPKLQILTMQFPKLKLIWSPGAHYTAEIFHELKRGKEQPDPEKALGIQKESSGSHSYSRYNPIPHALLSKMPGIDSRNIYSLLRRCNSLSDLAKLSEIELASLLENGKNASVLYSALHSNILIEYPFDIPETKASKTAAAASTKATTANTFRVTRPKGGGTKKN